MRKLRLREIKWLFSITSLESKGARSWENLMAVSPVFLSIQLFWGDHTINKLRVAILIPRTNRSRINSCIILKMRRVYYFNFCISWELSFLESDKIFLPKFYTSSCRDNFIQLIIFWYIKYSFIQWNLDGVKK